jgi:hypothetical protein
MAGVKIMVDKCKCFFKYLMETPDVNSRFIFLFHTVSSCLCVIVLSIAFMFVKDRSAFPTMVGAVGGTGVAAAFGRWATKKGGADGDVATTETEIVTTPGAPAPTPHA